jgi:hypothetical protein
MKEYFSMLEDLGKKIVLMDYEHSVLPRIKIITLGDKNGRSK